jgi:hypothetical protein
MSVAVTDGGQLLTDVCPEVWTKDEYALLQIAWKNAVERIDDALNHRLTLYVQKGFRSNVRVRANAGSAAGHRNYKLHSMAKVLECQKKNWHGR